MLCPAETRARSQGVVTAAKSPPAPAAVNISPIVWASAPNACWASSTAASCTGAKHIRCSMLTTASRRRASRDQR